MRRESVIDLVPPQPRQSTVPSPVLLNTLITSSDYHVAVHWVVGSPKNSLETAKLGSIPALMEYLTIDFYDHDHRLAANSAPQPITSRIVLQKRLHSDGNLLQYKAI